MSKPIQYCKIKNNPIHYIKKNKIKSGGEKGTFSHPRTIAESKRKERCTLLSWEELSQ